jgi:hypothetical protein
MLKYNFYNANNSIICVTYYAGKPVKSTAKCDPGDQFDYTTGKKLAKLRCNAKVKTKQAKYAAEQYRIAREEYQKAKAHLEDMQSFMDKTAEDMIKAKTELEEYEKELV